MRNGAIVLRLKINVLTHVSSFKCWSGLCIPSFLLVTSRILPNCKSRSIVLILWLTVVAFFFSNSAFKDFGWTVISWLLHLTLPSADIASVMVATKLVVVAVAEWWSWWSFLILPAFISFLRVTWILRLRIWITTKSTFCSVLDILLITAWVIRLGLDVGGAIWSRSMVRSLSHQLLSKTSLIMSLIVIISWLSHLHLQFNLVILLAMLNLRLTVMIFTIFTFRSLVSWIADVVIPIINCMFCMWWYFSPSKIRSWHLVLRVWIVFHLNLLLMVWFSKILILNLFLRLFGSHILKCLLKILVLLLFTNLSIDELLLVRVNKGIVLSFLIFHLGIIFLVENLWLHTILLHGVVSTVTTHGHFLLLVLTHIFGSLLLNVKAFVIFDLLLQSWFHCWILGWYSATLINSLLWRHIASILISLVSSGISRISFFLIGPCSIGNNVSMERIKVFKWESWLWTTSLSCILSWWGRYCYSHSTFGILPHSSTTSIFSGLILNALFIIWIHVTIWLSFIHTSILLSLYFLFNLFSVPFSLLLLCLIHILSLSCNHLSISHSSLLILEHWFLGSFCLILGIMSLHLV